MGRLVVAALLLIWGCVPLPGDEGQPCSAYGFCAPGLVCDAHDFCVEPLVDCEGGLCEKTEFTCGWFLGPKDIRAAAEMCQVDAGSYQLGQPPTQTEVSPTFYIDRFEVTNLRYRGFLTSLDQARQAEMLPACDPGDRGWSATPPFYEQRFAQHPVVCVTRRQAQAYCSWAGKLLPTGLQWEAAARGQDGRLYPWGDDDPAGDLANCQNSAGSEGYCNDVYPPDTCPGASGPTLCDDTAPIFDPDGEPTLPDGASPWKVLHMAGNVWEWTAGDSSPGMAQLRGGSWADFFGDLTVTVHREVSATDYRKTTVGFRCSYQE